MDGAKKKKKRVMLKSVHDVNLLTFKCVKVTFQNLLLSLLVLV